MGEIFEGVLGGVSGKVGPVIGGSWRGIKYIRGRCKRRKDNPSEAQTIHRAKFAVATRFISVMSGLFSSSFKDVAQKQTTTNAALGNVMENAITGVYPDI